MVWYGMVLQGIFWFGLILFEKKDFFFLHVKFDALSIPQCGPKVCGGENGAAAGARMSRLTLVISLESKLINKF